MPPEIKLPMQAAIDQTIDLLRRKADCTDAVVILANHHTGECKISTISGDVNHIIQILQRTLTALHKAGHGRIGLVKL